MAEQTDNFEGFRDHQFETSQLPTALAHLYRAQVGRADAWRTRLDSSTNWAVVTTAAALTVAFGEPDVSHFMIPLFSLLITLFWGLESRRYRYFELWSTRVRLLEKAYFANLLEPDPARDTAWVTELADSLRNPHFTISIWEALGRRYRRVYVWVHSVLGFSWLVNIWIHPTPLPTFQAVMHRQLVAGVPAWVLLCVGIVFHAALLGLALRTKRLRHSDGEVFYTAR